MTMRTPIPAGLHNTLSWEGFLEHTQTPCPFRQANSIKAGGVGAASSRSCAPVYCTGPRFAVALLLQGEGSWP